MMQAKEDYQQMNEYKFHVWFVRKSFTIAPEN